MKLSIDLTLSNAEPGSYGHQEDVAVRCFNIEIPGTTERFASQGKIIKAAEGLAGYTDVIQSMFQELNEKIAAKENEGGGNGNGDGLKDDDSTPPAPACLAPEGERPAVPANPFEGAGTPADADHDNNPFV